MIAVFGKENFTQACINDLSKLDKRHQIIIIDNGSDAKSVESIEKLVVNKNNDYNVACDFRLFKFSENKGFGKANNYAYNIARDKLGGADDDLYIFLNNDIRVKNNKNGWTDLLLEKATNNNLVGPTGGLVDAEYNFVYEAEDASKVINYMSGWCLGALGSVVERIANEFRDNTYHGIFPDYNLAYFEDTHMSMVASKLGIDFNIVELPLVHFKRTTGKTMNLPELYIKARGEFLKRIGDKWK